MTFDNPKPTLVHLALSFKKFNVQNNRLLLICSFGILNNWALDIVCNLKIIIWSFLNKFHSQPNLQASNPQRFS